MNLPSSNYTTCENVKREMQNAAVASHAYTETNASKQ